MLFNLALVLLGFWLTHVSGLLPLGSPGHLLLLAGLAILLLSFVRARETAIHDPDARARGNSNTRADGH